MDVNHSNKTLHTGTHSYPAKCLCQVFFVFLCALLLQPHVYATTVQHINTSSKTEASSGVKKVPKHKSDIATTQTVASPKLTLSPRISNVKLAAIASSTSAGNPGAGNQSTLGASSLPPETGLNARLSTESASTATNDTSVQYQTKKVAVEQELEYENRLLLGLTLIFLTGLVIIYIFSKYRLLL